MVDCTCCFTDGCPRFTAHNCLPLHRRHFSKYDSLILMCLGKHQPNANATLHAWGNRRRCCLIISPTCTLNWSVNSATISSSPLRPSADQFCFDWWQLHVHWTQLLFSWSSWYFHSRQITLVQYLMEILFSRCCLVCTSCRCVKKKKKKIEQKLRGFYVHRKRLI